MQRTFAEHPAATTEYLTAAVTVYVTEKFGRRAKRAVIYVLSLQTRLSRPVTRYRVIITGVFVRARSREIRIENTTTSTTTRRQSPSAAATRRRALNVRNIDDDRDDTPTTTGPPRRE